MSEEIGFKPVRHCPVCNEHHEVKYQYRGTDVLCCPKMEEGKMALLTEEYAKDEMERFKRITRL